MKMEKQQIIDGLAKIEAAIVPVEDITNSQEIMTALNNLVQWMPSSASYVAATERMYAEKISELVMHRSYSQMSASDKKLLFNGLAKDEYELKILAERLNKAISHATDALRSMLSTIKEEMKLNQYQPS